MNANPNYTEMARRFWDMWQEQVSHTMNDKEFIRAMLEMMQSGPFSANQAPAQDPYATSSTSPSRRTTAASEPRHAAMDELAKRLDELDRRMAVLEAAFMGMARGVSKSHDQPPERSASKPRSGRRPKA